MNKTKEIQSPTKNENFEQFVEAVYKGKFCPKNDGTESGYCSCNHLLVEEMKLNAFLRIHGGKGNLTQVENIAQVRECAKDFEIEQYRNRLALLSQFADASRSIPFELLDDKSLVDTQKSSRPKIQKGRFRCFLKQYKYEIIFSAWGMSVVTAYVALVLYAATLNNYSWY